MTKRFLKALSLTAGMAAILGSSVLQAAGHRSEPVQIPFEFRVRGQQFPAGTYRIMHRGGDGVAALVNEQTGKRIQILHPATTEKGKTKLIFEHDAEGYVLKKLS